MESEVYAGSKFCLSLDMCTAFAIPCDMKASSDNRAEIIQVIKYLQDLRATHLPMGHEVHHFE